MASQCLRNANKYYPMDDILKIESLDMEARGVGHLINEDGSAGKVIFVEGALPGERVRFKSYRRKLKWEIADMTEDSAVVAPCST